jgi:hypothetical protein
VGIANRYTDALDKKITDELKQKLPLLSQPGPAAALANMEPGLRDTLNNVTAATMEVRGSRFIRLSSTWADPGGSLREEELGG